MVDLGNLIRRGFRVRVYGGARCGRCGNSEFEVVDVLDESIPAFVGKCTMCGEEYIITGGMVEEYKPA